MKSTIFGVNILSLFFRFLKQSFESSEWFKLILQNQNFNLHSFFPKENWATRKNLCFNDSFVF